MSAFNHEYPYTDFHELNLDWVIKTIKELNVNLETMEERILAITREFTTELVNERMAKYKAEVDAEIAELNRIVDDCIDDFNNLRTTINYSLRQMELRVDDLNTRMTAEINAVNARTDLAIQQNNEYLLSHMERELANIKVNNALTGTLYTVQGMFNYLCALHMTDAITYTELAGKENTYTQLAGYHMTYTELAVKGDLIIQ